MQTGEPGQPGSLFREDVIPGRALRANPESRRRQYFLDSGFVANGLRPLATPRNDG
jgi:hypothetical protein